MVRQDHPSEFSFRLTRRSRALFVCIFVSQKSARVSGRRPFRQVWPCQKQPCTKITFMRDLNTRSGFPGRSLPCSRNRYPRRWATDRTVNSGAVSFERMRDISLLLCSVVIRSISVEFCFVRLRCGRSALRTRYCAIQMNGRYRAQRRNGCSWPLCRSLHNGHYVESSIMYSRHLA